MLPDSSSWPKPAKMAHSRNLAHASLETAVNAWLQKYIANLRWTIKGPVGRALKIEFEDFDLVPPRRYPNNVTHCVHDYIYVSEFILILG